MRGFDAPAGKGVDRHGRGQAARARQREVPRRARTSTRAPLAPEAERLRQDGATAIFLAVDGKLAGVIAIADPVKATTPEALKALAAEGVRVVMLTGDNRTTAQAVAKRLGITEVEAEVLPDQKSAVIEKLRREGRVVAMAGDGVNDAPALAAADVGIAMGTGTDVAIESAGITLLKGDLTGIVQARALSQAAMRNIRQNLFFAFIYNAAGVPIAAGVLYPVFGSCCRRSSPPPPWRCRRSAWSAMRCGCAARHCRPAHASHSSRYSASWLGPPPPSAAEWRVSRVNAPARVTAIETVAGQAQVNAGGLWYRIVLDGEHVSLAFIDTPAKPKLPDGALPDGHVATGTRDIARAWLAEPTTRYDHGILGDKIEAGAW